MRPFSVSVRTGDTEVVAEALRAAGMEKHAEQANRVAGDADGLKRVSVTVVFEAVDAASAEARVREAVGDRGEVGPAKRVGSDA